MKWLAHQSSDSAKASCPLGYTHCKIETHPLLRPETKPLSPISVLPDCSVSTE